MTSLYHKSNTSQSLQTTQETHNTSRMGMKRYREEGEVKNISAMARCLLLLSRGEQTVLETRSPGRIFECKTCSRQFSSFQALGGHRASHKKPKLMGEDPDNENGSQNSQLKPKTHECSICGLEFGIGQALGGHMRRHRNMMNEDIIPLSVQNPVEKTSRSFLCLDLNLTPLENDLKLQLGGLLSEELASPAVSCFT